MRKSGKCPKCGHLEILDVLTVPDSAQARIPTPAGIAIAAVQGPFGEYLRATGRLSACVCADCGFTELYTADPRSIPLDDRWVVKRRVGGEGPYR